MAFVERRKDETLASHLLRNAIQLQLTVGQRRRLTEAYRLMQGGKADKAEGRRIANEVQTELETSSQAAALAAERRGETVAVYNGAGAQQIRARDGVAALAAAKTKGAKTTGLSDGETRTAIAYRYMFEHATAGLRSQLGSVDANGSRRMTGGLPGRSIAELQRAYVLARLDQVERRVLKDQKNGLELSVLRLVAGEGLTLSAVASRGKSRDLHLDALRRALASVAAALHEPLANRCEVKAPT